MKAPITLVAVLLLAGCSGGVEATAPADLSDVEGVTKVVQLTEANDPNDMLGRPNGYSAATVYHDKRAECDEPAAVDCGAKVEVFDSADAAEERSDYIQTLLEEAPILGSEYHYIDGTALLRVSGQLTKSQADAYGDAFTR